MSHPHGPGPVYSWNGQTPRIADTAWIAPNAVVAGDVEIGSETSVWFFCMLRGDVERIRIGARTNIQDGSILHVSRDQGPLSIGDDVTIGHGVILHACTLHHRAFIGMGATVMDFATVGEGGMLAAGSLLTPGKTIGPGELWSGSPARLMRLMSAEDTARYARNAPNYVRLARQYAASLHTVATPD